MTEQDLIDLAIEYALIHSTTDFRQRSAKARGAILRQMMTVAGA